MFTKKLRLQPQAVRIFHHLKTQIQIKRFINKKSYEKSPGSATITNPALPRHQQEEEPDKTKQAQIEQTYEKH